MKSCRTCKFGGGDYPITCQFCKSILGKRFQFWEPKEEEPKVKSCGTCKYEDTLKHRPPCYDCNWCGNFFRWWRPKEECSATQEILDGLDFGCQQEDVEKVIDRLISYIERRIEE